MIPTNHDIILLRYPGGNLAKYDIEYSIETHFIRSHSLDGLDMNIFFSPNTWLMQSTFQCQDLKI